MFRLPLITPTQACFRGQTQTKPMTSAQNLSSHLEETHYTRNTPKALQTAISSPMQCPIPESTKKQIKTLQNKVAKLQARVKNLLNITRNQETEIESLTTRNRLLDKQNRELLTQRALSVPKSPADNAYAFIASPLRQVHSESYSGR